ncbi:hypothetical protein [Protaetiibacter intestinalis]|uniref:hypothetical protein n=1 Tax=Protaetiibacter intestinalis TaxID=2419774 RepID=UPI001D036082|nr:hypothetical protein [Protaetiibacter intestinalis]
MDVPLAFAREDDPSHEGRLSRRSSRPDVGRDADVFIAVVARQVAREFSFNVTGNSN